MNSDADFRMIALWRMNWEESKFNHSKMNKIRSLPSRSQSLTGEIENDR